MCSFTDCTISHIRIQHKMNIPSAAASQKKLLICASMYRPTGSVLAYLSVISEVMDIGSSQPELQVGY